MARIRSAVAAHPKRTAVIVIVLIALIGFVLYWFEPQALLIDKRIDEDLPTTSSEVQTDTDDETSTDESGGADGEKGDGGNANETAPEPQVIARGTLRGINHSANGAALLVKLADGSHILRFEDLAAENGPDLRVYLSAAPATSDGPAFNDDYVELGELKGNVGNQNYLIPGDVNLDKYRSAVIWCKRFEVGFAVAGLE